jgi:hypothetical protein
MAAESSPDLPGSSSTPKSWQGAVAAAAAASACCRCCCCCVLCRPCQVKGSDEALNAVCQPLALEAVLLAGVKQPQDVVTAGGGPQGVVTGQGAQLILQGGSSRVAAAGWQQQGGSSRVAAAGWQQQGGSSTVEMPLTR